MSRTYAVASLCLLLVISLSACAGAPPAPAEPPTSVPSPAPAVMPTDTPRAAPRPTHPAPQGTPTRSPTETRVPLPTELVRPTAALATDATTPESVNVVTMTPLSETWVLAKDNAKNLAINLPAGWLAFDVTAGTLDETLADLAQKQPGLAAVLASQARDQLDQGLLFMAADPATVDAAAGSATQLTIARRDLPGETDLDNLAKLYQTTAKHAKGFTGEVAQKPLALAAGPAVQLTYQVETEADGAKRVTATVQVIYLQSPTRAYLLTYNTAGERLAADAPRFEQSALSFTLAP